MEKNWNLNLIYVMTERYREFFCCSFAIKNNNFEIAGSISVASLKTFEAL